MSGRPGKNRSNPHADSSAQRFMKIINPPAPPFRKGGFRGDLKVFSRQILYPATTKSNMCALRVLICL